MDSIIINGGRKLVGEIDLQGSKNSSLPILAATVLVNGISVIHNCPELTDVDAAIKILEHLGCKVKREKNTLTVDSSEITCYNIPQKLMREMRSSIVFLGSVLGRKGKATLCAPGGCEIGLRPIDLHLKALKSMGVSVKETGGEISCRVENAIVPSVISLSFPSVGATENIILAATLSKTRTVIINGAREPEIQDLADFLNNCGAMIQVRKEGTIIVDGVNSLHGCEHRVIPDRIVALTYMSAVAAAGGNVIIKNAVASHFLSVIPVFEAAGCIIRSDRNNIQIKMNTRPIAVRDIRTMPYPGFPTDAQAPVMAMTCVARGTSVIVENIFESRFKHVNELSKMGAQIKVEGKVAVIDGVDGLNAAKVQCPDLRGGSALVVAGLAARGVTVIDSVSHIDRGYEKIEESLKLIGADISRVENVDSLI